MYTLVVLFFFFFNDTATTEIYTLSLHDALPISPLARLFRTARPVLVGTTSATGFMEMAVRNGVRHRALSLVNGSFSERFANLVRTCGKECIRLDVPLGCAVEPHLLPDALRGTPVGARTLRHSE